MRSVKVSGAMRLLFTLVGGYSARCRDCSHTFVARPFRLTHIVWAKCPRCYRLDLSMWDPEYYRSSAWMNLKVFFGANRWRCERCRVNFVSFRPRKLRYVRPTATEEPARDYEGATPME